MLRMKVAAISPCVWATFALAFGISASGCGGQESASQALDHALSQANVSKQAVGRFSGSVTIDGQPPGIKVYDKHRIIIMLYDPKNPPSDKHPILYVDCMPEPVDGTFEFSTYDRGDGVPAGSYIALFEDLPTRWGGGYAGSDRFKNRFNDPDQNEKDPQFRVEVTGPGRTDWQFDLVTEGKSPPSTPGPKTVLRPQSGK
jgi:hypothetical protein